MRHSIRIASLIVALIVSAIAFSQTSPAPISLPTSGAMISDLKGEVWVSLPQQAAVPAQRGQAIGADTTVEAKRGSALLVLSDGSQVLVKSNTKVILRDPNQANGNFLEQLIGKIVAKITKRSGAQPSFKMGTPSAVITVRGTEFLVEVTGKQRTFVQVYDGLVQVESLGVPSHPVLLQPGFVTQVNRNHVPEEPRRSIDQFAEGGGSNVSRSSGNEDRKRTGGQSSSGQDSGGGEGPDN